MEEAPVAKKLPHNAPGKYYTTEECDGCAYCASVAPDNFDFEKESNTYFVARQPVGREEEDIFLEAKEDCPVDAIQTVTNSKEESPDEN
jgi:ferredoxin